MLRYYNWLGDVFCCQMYDLQVCRIAEIKREILVSKCGKSGGLLEFVRLFVCFSFSVIFPRQSGSVAQDGFVSVLSFHFFRGGFKGEGLVSIHKKRILYFPLSE